jgi:hypothetical protein
MADEEQTMTEEKLTPGQKAKLKKKERELQNFRLEKRIIDGKEVEIKIYEEMGTRTAQVCR